MIASAFNYSFDNFDTFYGQQCAKCLFYCRFEINRGIDWFNPSLHDFIYFYENKYLDSIYLSNNVINSKKY